MVTTFFWIIIGIFCFEFVLERILSALNSSYRSKPVPKLLEGIYDEEKYRKSQQYGHDKDRFGMLSSGISFIATLCVLVFGGFGWLDGFVRQFSGNEIIVSLLFFGILGLAADILSTPFALYSTFVIEEKYGFNRTTPKVFVLDKLKSWLLSLLIGAPLFALIIWLFEISGDLFWIWAWIVMSAFSLFMMLFYSNLIVPLFNKQKPLEEGKLRDAIESFAQKAGFKLKNIYTIDGSKRSTKANAYFTGLGPKKRIVLYDTLINELSTDGIVAVLAHEVGHYKHKHTLFGLVSGILQTGLLLFLLSLFIQKGSDIAAAISSAIAGGTAVPASFHLGILAFGILYSPVSMILGLGGNVLSRKFEYQADAFAAKYDLGDALINALKTLSKTSLSNLVPHPAYVFVYFSHPTLLQRVKAIVSGK